MTITLQPITKENWRDVYLLTKTLTNEQRGFVADNAYSMLEALYDPDQLTEPRAIYAGETLVGFVMTYNDREYREHWIDRLMIAGEHQGKGYGRAALSLVVEQFRQAPIHDGLYISFKPENDAARRLYSSLGFLDTGIVQDGEIVFRLPLREATES